MLTNVFYYGYYKPYILGSPKSGAKGAAYAENTGQVRDAGTKLTRNNSVKKAVRQYAGDVCRNIMDIKDAAKYLSRNAESYYMTVLDEGFESAREWASEDIAQFTSAFNDAVSFGLSQEHSAELTRYADDLVRGVSENSEDLKKAGISLNDNTMSFNPEQMQGMDFLDLGNTLSGVRKAADTVYDRTRELLVRPISEYMDFKRLSFYYNYRIDPKKSPAANRKFSQLESGLILDRTL